MHTGMYLTNTELLRDFRQLVGIVFPFFFQTIFLKKYIHVHIVYMVGRYQHKRQHHYTLIKCVIFWINIKLKRVNQMMPKTLFTLTVNVNQHQKNLQKPSTTNKKNPKIHFLWCYLWVYFQCRKKFRTSQLCMVLDLP